MPTQSASDIVNALFAGQKDLSDYVDTAMKNLAVDAIDAKKQDVGKTMFTQPEEPEATPETEETPDETDQRGD
jgi:DNA-directed RNA polymerase specialized sigma24 family protein